MLKTASNNNNNNNILNFDNTCSSNKIMKMETSSIKQLITSSTTTTTTATNESKSPSSTTTLRKNSIKIERRLSSTSESSVEPMDLGRTPTPPPPPPSSSLLTLNCNKKLNKKIKSQQNNFHNNNNNNNDNDENDHNEEQKNDNINNELQTTPKRRPSSSHSQNDTADEPYESTDEQEQQNSKPKNFDTKKLRFSNNNNNSKNNRYNNNRFNNHHFCHNNTVVEIESSDNPNSLRKKFRISTPNRNNNNIISSENNNKYCKNDNEVNNDDNDIEPNNNNNNNEEDKRKLKINGKNNDKNNLLITIKKNSTTSSPASSSSRRGSDDNDDHLSNNGSNGPGSGLDDDDCNNRTNQNESGFVDGSSHNLINSINSISSPESGGGIINGTNANNIITTSGNGHINNNNSNNNNNERNNNNINGTANNNNNNNNEDIKYVCPICEVVSATPHEFTNHIRSHNYSSGDSENFTCRICSKVLSSASSLDRHVLVHTGERPFNCKYCHLTFTTNGNMHRHMRTHKQHPHQKRRSSNNNNNNSIKNNNNNNKDSNNINNKTNNNNNNNINNKISNTNLLNSNINSNSTNNNSTTILNLQLNNGISNNTTTTITTATTTNTTTTTNNIQTNSTSIIQNGNIDGGESYESEDGGCSTDSSASNNSSNCNNIRNYNGINSTKIITTNNQNTLNTTINNNNNNSFKRKSTDDDINGIIKRRMKTINNNTIINENDSLNNFISSTTTTTTTATTNLTSSNIENNNENEQQQKSDLQQQQQQQSQKFCCPVCNRNDFINMPTLSNHMDNEHSDIPAKCRQCDVVFKTHNQLSTHRCCLIKQQHQPQQVQQQQQQQQQTTFMQGIKDLTFVEFNNEKFPFITNSLCEQNIRQSIVNPKFECSKCYLAFPCSNSLEIHQQDCNVIENKNLKPVPHLIDPQALILSNMLMQHPSTKSDLPKDFSMQKMFNIQQLLKRKQQQQQQKNLQKIEDVVHDEPEKIILNNNNNNIQNNFERLSSYQLKRSLSCESLNSNENFNITSDNQNNSKDEIIVNHNRDDFLAHFNLKNKSIMNLNENNISDNINNSNNNNILNNNSIESKNIKQNSEKILEFNALNLNRISSPISHLNKSNSSPIKQNEIDLQNDNSDQKLQQQLQQNDSRDLADIQSILNVTASSSNFLRNFEANVNTPMGSECGYGKDEEEAQDSFTAEFRKMKLRGEFPCKLCTAVFPNLRALKGHNRIHVSAAGNAGPYRCNMCLYSIHDKAALLRHMRTHNGDRPYECAVCNYAFTTKANCERHLRNRHSKTTRDEVKRAIIYHPSEDSSCDDPTKKLHLFSSPDFDNDDELQINPKDRSTPVSHLKEILQSESTLKPSVKIQVKSLEKLIDQNPTTGISSSIMSGNSFQSRFENDNIHSNDKIQDLEDSIDSQQHDSGRAIDLSMDVLDLSKKSKPVPEDNSIPPKPDIIPDALKFDLSQQWLLAQQQFFAEALPKMDANYLQLCRNLALPLSFNPFLTAFSPLLSNGIGDFSKFAPFMNSAALFGNQPNPIPVLSIPTDPSTNENNINNSQTQHISPNQLKLETNENTLKNVASTVTSSNVQLLPKTLGTQSTSMSNVGNQMNLTPTQNLPQSQRLPAQKQQLQTNNLNQSVNNNGPVKMVIKNGVLMPKQKQRRYRTERPFACEHCSACFTLRSNMERHIKQQHPEFWEKRQRSGQHVVRGRGSSSNVMSHMQSSHSRMNSRIQTQNSLPQNHFGTISDQVKCALLAQQLKARQGTDILHQALTEGSNNASYNNNPTIAHNNGNLEDDDTDSKLIIDEDDHIEETEDFDEIENEIAERVIGNLIDEQQDEKFNIKIKNLTQHKEKNICNVPNNMLGAKKVAETILEQAIKSGSSAVNKQLSSKTNPNEENLKIANNMISRAESVGKYLKEVASSSFKSDEFSDLASVSKLVDNATNNTMSFNNYFKPNDMTESTNNVNHMEQSDEEGLVASGSASDNNSGAEESVQINAPDGQQKKKSAYSLAPNRVPCPYCDRIFPWSSSLRRHILTHTGQKPFKCSHCPLLFTTKSNCDRHLLRKHGNVESAVSLYVPIDDMPDPVPMPKAVAEAFQAAKAAAAASNCNPNSLLTVSQQSQQQQQQQQKKLINSEENQETIKYQNSAQIINAVSKSEPQTIVQISSTDLPFKCHLCDSSFSERMHCLDHIKSNHIQEFSLLLAKGAIDTEIDLNAIQMHNSTTEEDDKRDDGRGKYPDYANRKVICAFCIRRFWSTEDLRRHMRTHSGERPFQCEVCLRKFTLKHSMLRHMKKHNGSNHNNQMITQNSGSDCSDDEQPTSNMILANTLRNHNIHELLSKVHNSNNNNNINGGNDWQNKSEDNNDSITNSVFNSGGVVNPSTGNNGTNSDLIGNLLGISDQSLLNKFLTNPGEAAKFFGVDK